MPMDEALLRPHTSSKDKPGNSKYSEDVARVLVLNPAMLSLFFGMGINAFLDQFLKIWPDFRREALPYISIPTVILAGVGWQIGSDSIRYPNSEIGNSPIKRSAMASVEGIGVILPFFLLNLFQIYCHYFAHLDAKGHCEVSDEIFWEDFFTAPAILSALYIAWNSSIDPAKKCIWISPKEEEKSLKSKVKKSLVIGADILSLMLFYSRIIQTAMFIYLKPTPLLCEGVAAPATLIALVGEIFQSQHRQKIDTAMRLLMNAGLITYFIKTKIAQQSGTQWYHSWSLMLELLSLPSLFLMGLLYTAYYRRQYFEERSKIPGCVPTNIYSFPVQQKISDALKDPREQERIIKTILTDENSRKRIVSELERTDTGSIMENDATSSFETAGPPKNMKDILQLRYHKEILAIILRDLGLASEVQDDADELDTVDDGAVKHQPSTSKATTAQQSSANANSGPLGTLLPAYTAHAKSYHATGDVGPSVSASASPPKPR